MWDILYELASVGQLPLPPSTSAKNKRERGAEESKSATDAGGPGIIKGRRRPAPPDTPNTTTTFDDANTRPAQPGRRQNVPAIVTHFPPRNQNPAQYEPDTPLSATLRAQHGRYTSQRRQYAAGPETPLSSASPHGQQPVAPSMQHEESHGRAFRHQPGPPDTPLSASSLRGDRPDSFAVPHHEHRSRLTQPETLSTLR